MITVTTIYEGALDDEATFPNDKSEEAYTYADKMAAECREHAEQHGGVSGGDWAVYVLEGDVQFSTDHHPYLSSDPTTWVDNEEQS